MNQFKQYAILFLSLLACRHAPLLSFNQPNKEKIIAIQPIGAFSDEDIELLSSNITRFYGVRVVQLKPIGIQKAFELDSKGSLSADAVLLSLANNKPDSVTIIIGITHSDIFTQTESDYMPRTKSVPTAALKGIFGVGYMNGTASLVSDHRLAVNGNSLFNDRLYKVILHELGHNLGLLHCLTASCVMSKENTKIWMLDYANSEYCIDCRQKLQNR